LAAFTAWLRLGTGCGYNLNRFMVQVKIFNFFAVGGFPCFLTGFSRLA